MRVVHLALTPVAGGPWNIVRALNSHTPIEARLVVLDPLAYGGRIFPGDLDWSAHRDQCINAIAAADVIHMHQFFDPAAVFGKEVGDLCAKKVKLRQYHSAPSHFVGDDPAKIAWLLSDPMPQLVIGQFHERYYPRARVVPNLIAINAQELLPSGSEGKGVPVIAWSPSVRDSAWCARWATKGYPETCAVLASLADEGVCSVDTIEDVPYLECLRRKSRADLIVDEMVTGSYHLSGLEGLAQGKAVLGWLDARTQLVLREMTGANDLPWINSHLEDARAVLRRLLVDQDLLKALGRESRAWMETWYDDRILVRHYVNAYRDLFERPALFESRRADDIVSHWRNVTLPDVLWQMKKARKSGWRC